MKYTYTIEKIKYGKNKIIYIPIFSDTSLEILTEFLSSEMSNFKKDILDIIEKAKNNPKKIEFSGNVCLLIIENNMVKIECTIDDIDIGKPVEVELEIFNEIINSWIKSIQNLKNK